MYQASIIEAGISVEGFSTTDKMKICCERKTGLCSEKVEFNLLKMILCFQLLYKISK